MFLVRLIAGNLLLVSGAFVTIGTLVKAHDIQQYKIIPIVTQNKIEYKEKVVEKPVLVKPSGGRASSHVTLRDVKVSEKITWKETGLATGFYQLVGRDGAVRLLDFCFNTTDSAPEFPKGTHFKSLTYSIWDDNVFGKDCQVLLDATIDKEAKW